MSSLGGQQNTVEKEELIAAASIDDELVLVCVCCTTAEALLVLLAVIAPGAISQVTVSLSLFAGNFQHKCVVVLPPSHLLLLSHYPALWCVVLCVS